MKVYLNKEYKCVKVEDNTFVANDSSNYIRYYFVTNANGDVIDKMDDTSVIYRNTEPSYVTVAFRRADGDVIQHLMASPKTDATGKSFFEYEITNTDGVLYKKGALEISAQFIEATLSEAGGVKKVISQKVKAVAINTAHVLDNIGEEAEEYYSQYEQANNDAHAVLQAQITTNFNNIGTLQELTTDVKDDLVKAINEVNAHADANKSEIGDLSTLTTDEKTTIVGAINEVDAHSDANKTEIGNLSALTTDEKATLVGAINEVDNHADNATTLANNAVATANGAVATANEAKTTAQTAETNANSAVDKANAANATADEAKAIAQGSQRAIGFATLQAAITALNGYSNTQLKVGDNVYIVETGVPDLWVAAVEQNSVAYNYTTNDAFNDDLVKNTLVQVGYYKFAYLESDGKPCTVAWQNMTVAESDWVASTEFEDFAYEAKIILSDFVNFSSIPQVVFGLTEATSGNYAPICKAGDKGVYIYSKVNTAITLPTVVTFAPNVHGASMQGGGYTNKGKWVASTTYAIDDLVYTDNGQYVCIEGITSTTSPEQDTTHWQATFVATGKTKNGLKFSGQNTDGSAVQKTFDGSTAVEIAFDETTMTAKEVDGVLKVGAKGTIPEALPQEASALKSGNLPTTGWKKTGFQTFWEGTAKCDASTYKPIGTSKALADILYSDDTAYMMVDYNYQYYGSYNQQNVAFSYKNSNASVGSMTGISFRSGNQVDNPTIFITRDGTMYGRGSNFASSAYSVTYTRIGTSTISQQFYTISDTSITANSDILMELTDEGGVKANALASGSIQVIRDTVPTQPIPYTYKVKQTNTSGQFTVVNHFVPTIPETPTALPQEASALKNGNLPTSGWGVSNSLWTGSQVMSDYPGNYLGNIGKTWASSSDELAELPNGWQATMNGTLYANITARLDSDSSTRGIQFGITGTGIGAEEAFVRIYTNGNIYVWNNKSSETRTITQIGCSLLSKQTYTISDSDITANSDILMELTDEGGVKSYSMEAGKMTVIRDNVPTSPIPYTYKVKQTNASGQFTLVNHYVGVTSVNGQTGAVTIAVPTKTSELENDSGYVRSVVPPIVRNVVCNDVDSAATLDTTITCEVGDLILAQIIVRSALTLPTEWTLLRTIPAVETSSNQTLSFAYKRATSTSETLTVTQASAGRIYTNLVRLSNATSISYIQSCEKTGTSIKSISSTKPVTPNMVIWGAASVTWNTSLPYGDWAYSPSTLDYYSLPQATKQPRLGTFIDSSGAGTRTFTIPLDSSNSMMCGAVEIVGDEVARKGDIPTKTSQLTNDSGFITAADIPSAGEWVDVPGEATTLTEAGTYQFVTTAEKVQSIIYWDGTTSAVGIPAVALNVNNSSPEVITLTPVINTDGRLIIHQDRLVKENNAWVVKGSAISTGFKYRKIN